MIRALWTAASGMQSQQLNIDVIANNLANVNTTGFKKSRADFQDLMYQNLKTTGAPSTSSTQIPSGIQVGLGSKAAAVNKVFSAGNISQTGNDLDLAIEGSGFFTIQTPAGVRYTRNGNFTRQTDGAVTTVEGDALLTDSGPLNLPPGQGFSIYSLAAVLPFLAAKQRETHRNDWMTSDAEIACPDPNCQSRLRITRLDKRQFSHRQTTAVPLPGETSMHVPPTPLTELDRTTLPMVAPSR